MDKFGNFVLRVDFVQLAVCWFFKKELVQLMQKNGFIVSEDTITTNELRNFFMGNIG